MLKLGSTEDKREQHHLMRDAMEKRFIRVTRGSIVGGIRLGMFTAAFYGVQNLLAEKRGVHDVFNVVGAGSATASAFGLISKKSYTASRLFENLDWIMKTINCSSLIFRGTFLSYGKASLG